MFRRALVVLAVLVAASWGGVMACDFGGDYLGVGNSANFSLNLVQNAGGGIAGTLSDGANALTLHGRPGRGGVKGDCFSEGGVKLGFTARFAEDENLHLKIFPYDQAGNARMDMGDLIILAPQTPAVATGAAGHHPTVGEHEVYINRVRLDPAVIEAAETQYQTRIENGRYWYDAACGAWGVENGPTAGFLAAGLALPGPMPADISGGGTNIFINGREVHVLDREALIKVFGSALPGRYWLDAMGNIGLEGGPALVNLSAAIQASRQQESVTHGYDSTYGARGTVAGGMYSGRTASGKSVFWYPGM